MSHSVTGVEKGVQNMLDITSDFACLKVSVLKKASRISGEVDRITIGPEANVNEDEQQKSENIENEQNSCNIRAAQKMSRSQGSKISTQNGITFSMKKILIESEYQRKEEVRKEIERHWQHMNENGRVIKEHMAKSRSNMAKERERRSKENYAYILAEEKIAEQEQIRRRNAQQKDIEEYSKRIKEKEELIKKIMNLRSMFALKYRDIIVLTDSCKDKNSVALILSSYAGKLEELHRQIEVIDEKLKIGEIVGTDFTTMESMVNQINDLLCIFLSEIERINTQYEATLASLEAKQAQIQLEALREEPKIPETADFQPVIPQQSMSDVQSCEEKFTSEQQQRAEAAVSEKALEPAATEVNANEIAPTSDQSQEYLYKYVDKESLQIFIKSQQFLENYVKNHEDFLQSSSTKQFRFECQKAINIPVNAISGINEQHLTDKYERLHSLLIGKSSPNVNQHPQGAAFCKNILAKKIVNQGETLVSSKPKMAFPIAAIVVALWNDHADFGNLLLSHFHKACPFTVPVFMPKLVGQSNEDYYKSMGYKYSEDGTVENHDKFLKRMSGLMRLYASIIITSQRRGIVKSNPHGLQHAWRWLAAILNIEPRTEVADLSATLLLDMLEVAGNALWTAYPKQFQKLLILLFEEYYPRMQKVGCIGGGPLVRLEEFLRNCLSKTAILPPEGQLPPNFW